MLDDTSTVVGDDMALFDAMIAAPMTDQVRAASIVARRGRAYRAKNKMVTLHVFTTSESDANAIVKQYGGNYYKHSSGYQWSCSRRATLLNVAKDVLPIAHGGTHGRLSPLFAMIMSTEIIANDGVQANALAAAA